MLQLLYGNLTLAQQAQFRLIDAMIKNTGAYPRLVTLIYNYFAKKIYPLAPANFSDVQQKQMATALVNELWESKNAEIRKLILNQALPYQSQLKDYMWIWFYETSVGSYRIYYPSRKKSDYAKWSASASHSASMASRLKAEYEARQRAKQIETQKIQTQQEASKSGFAEAMQQKAEYEATQEKNKNTGLLLALIAGASLLA